MTATFIEYFKVRDYECDQQGIVNNAIYQHYLEHARHQYLLSRGIDFAELTRQGIHLVVVQALLDYRNPLKSGDEFSVSLVVKPKDRVRFLFEQEIHRLSDQKLCLTGKITGVALNERGRPYANSQLHARLFSADSGL